MNGLFYLDFIRFFMNVSFLFQDHMSNIIITCSCLFWSLRRFQTLFWQPWQLGDLLVRYFVHCSSIWVFLIFTCGYTGFTGFEEENTGVRCHPHCIMPGVLSFSMTHRWWWLATEQTVFSSFPTVTLSFLFPTQVMDQSPCSAEEQE